MKGVKTPINFDEMEKILQKGKVLKILQEKWYRDISNGTIVVKPEDFTLTLNDNKRRLIYDENGVFVDTEPLLVVDGKIVQDA